VGIYVQGYATFPASLQDGIAEQLLGSARSWAAEQGLNELFYGASTEAGIWISFYPPAGEIEFEIEPGGIGFGVKTSIAGPGYHAALVDLCDHLQIELGIVWRWEGGGDQTNYAVHRSLAELQEDFLDQLFAHCEFLKEDMGSEVRHAFNLPEGWAMDGYEGVATPLGPVAARRFLDVLDVPSDAETLAKRLYPWWGREIDQAFWVSALRALLWTDVRWRGARTRWETHVHSAALTLGERLRSVLDAPMRQAVTELASLSRDGESFIVPSRDGIGYLRRKRAFFLTGNWRIDLPGYYIEQLEDEGNTVCLWFGAEEIRGSSFALTPKSGETNELVWGTELAGQPDRRGNGFTYRLDPTSRPSTTDAGFYHTTGEFQAMDANGSLHLLILSLCGTEEDLTPRLSQIAEGVWLDLSRSRAGTRGH
jgi:hypothetical protein